jgi:hypothetical protein
VSVGSCILLRIGDQLFILTAAHVLDRLTSGLMVPGTQGAVLLGGRVLRSALPPGGRTADRLDAAVIVPREDVATALDDVPAFRPQDVDLDEWMTPAPATLKHHVLLGFPSTGVRSKRWEKTLSCKGFLLTARQALPDVYVRLGVETPTHVVLDYADDDVNTLTGPTHPPRPNGISGGAILACGQPFDVSAGNASLIAVITERHMSRNVLVGSRLTLFLELIRHDYPELGPQIPRSAGFHLSANRV